MRLAFAAAIAVSLLASCVSMPTGPSVMVLPGTGKSFDQFRADDMDCRQFASSQAGGSAEQAQADSAVKSAAIGTAVGAIAGAALGGSRGAIAGAGIGTAGGALAGTGAAGQTGRTLQQRYDIGYTQCMYAKGHQVPSAGRAMAPRPVYAAPATGYTPPPPPPPNYSAPPQYGAAPPPPPGTPPPPPPGAR